MKNKLFVRILSTILAWLVWILIFINNFFKFKKLNLKIASFVIASFVSDFKQLCDIRYEYDIFAKKMVNRLILNIPSYGCSYYFEKGGCAMCGFNNEIKKYQLREYNSLAIKVLVYLILLLTEKKIEEKKIQVDTLMIFMAGSFVNEQELPLDVQNLIINFFRKSNIKNLYIELRPEFALNRRNRMEEIVDNIKPKKLQVAFGFESANDYVRNKLIQKGISKKTYIQAVKTLKPMDVNIFTYILIGAPFRSLVEIEEDAVASAIFAWESGSDVVNFEVYCVQAGTLWEKHYLKQELVVLSLWSIFRIIKRANGISKNWYLGSFSDSPKPIKVPENCSKCSKKAKEVFRKLTKYHDINLLNELPKCSCGSVEIGQLTVN